MLKPYKLAALTLLAALAGSQVHADIRYPAAVVNGVPIPTMLVDMRADAAAAQGQPDTTKQRKAILENLIDRELMSQAAVKQGLDKQDETLRQLDMARQAVLVNAYATDYINKHPVMEDAIKQEYEDLEQQTGGKEYKASHILTVEESEAKSIAAQLENGGDFAQLTRQHSMDPGSRDKGGELDWGTLVNFVQPLADALATLYKGQVSAPVKSDFGWHIIKLDEVRDFKFPPYLEIKASLIQSLQRQSMQKSVADLRAKAEIKIN